MLNAESLLALAIIPLGLAALWRIRSAARQRAFSPA
jgi:hypothetical protein